MFTMLIASVQRKLDGAFARRRRAPAPVHFPLSPDFMISCLACLLSSLYLARNHYRTAIPDFNHTFERTCSRPFLFSFFFIYPNILLLELRGTVLSMNLEAARQQAILDAKKTVVSWDVGKGISSVPRLYFYLIGIKMTRLGLSYLTFPEPRIRLV
jgi:hypothetical protein